MPHATIQQALTIAPGAFHPDIKGNPYTGLPAFCEVIALLTPSSNSEIRIELWLPDAASWNQRFLGLGNGGFAGGIDYRALAGSLRHGFAVAYTDMGTAVPKGQNPGIFFNRPDRWADWGYRATHEMTVFSHQILHAFYEKNATYSYFNGCSTGGEQALAEAQRYPEDYDGILAGAPANNRIPLHVSILWNYAVTHTSQESWLPPEKIAVLSKAVLDACDALDGLKDGIVSDPEHCTFDPTVLQCVKADGSDCLTAKQIETVRKIYAGPVNPHTGKSLYPGLSKGSEFDWSKFSGATWSPNSPAPYHEIFEWVFGKEWDWRKFDYDRDFDTMIQRLAPLVNANNPDLNRFRTLGHKLIAYHGWADVLVPPEESVNYLNAVAGHTKGPLDDFYRLFMLPDMGHCGGGMDISTMIEWVEHGAAPTSSNAGVLSVTGSNKQSIQFPRCLYPLVQQYKGDGDPARSSSFFADNPAHHLSQGSSV